MRQFIDATGKTEEEAINRALEQLGRSPTRPASVVLVAALAALTALAA